MKNTLCSVLIATAVITQVRSQCLTTNDNRSPNKDGKAGLYSGQQEFSLALLEAVNKLNPNDNLFFSPYSTYHALLMAYFVTANQTEAFLKKSLRLGSSQDKADVYHAYKLDKSLTKLKSHDGTYEFTNANRIVVDKSVEVRDCIKNFFVDEVSSADFKTNPEPARLEINQWVEQQTHDMIKDLLAPGTIDRDTNLVLVNAAYFKGVWENKFDAAHTKAEVFYIKPSKRTFVDMMYVEGTFNHDISEDLKAHVLELPYQGGDISMYILLPPFLKEDAVETTLKNLTPERFRAIVEENSSLLAKTVQVSLPKFSLERTIEMVPILKSLGVGNLFRADADFSLLTTSGAVSLGAGVHKAKIQVDEEGVTAAAATAVFSFRMMNDEPPAVVRCDRPFVFLLYNKLTHTILFMGVYRQP